MQILWLLAACGGGVEARLQEVIEEAEQADALERERLRPVAEGVRSALTAGLSVPEEVVARMLTNLGERCAMVVDPEDPPGCDLRQGCRATLLVLKQGEWHPAGMGTVLGIPAPDRCEIGIRGQDFRRLSTLEYLVTTSGGGATP